MKHWQTAINAALEWAGEAVGSFWFSLLGIAILFSFQVTGIILSLLIGWGTMRLAGDGVWTFYRACLNL